MDKRRQSAAEVLKEIKDGSTIMISGFGEAGVPNTLLSQLKDLHPTNLTIVVNSVTRPLSLTHALIEANMVSKVITTSARGRGKGLSKFEEKLRDGEIELECLPQGTFSERIRAGGAGIPAFFTPVGYGTKLGEGKETRKTKRSRTKTRPKKKERAPHRRGKGTATSSRRRASSLSRR